MPRLVVAVTLLVFPTLLSALGASACGRSILGSDPSTGLIVEVRRGPINPVEVPGEENSAPVQGAVAEVRRVERGGRARLRTEADGRASILLAPGPHRVEVLECPGALALPAPDTVTVHRGAFALLRLECDTGIR